VTRWAPELADVVSVLIVTRRYARDEVRFEIRQLDVHQQPLQIEGGGGG
jgi:hypothetical protein